MRSLKVTVPSGVVCVCPAGVALRRLRASPDAHTHTLAPPGGTSALLAQQGPGAGPVMARALTRPLPVQVGCKLSLVFFQYCKAAMGNITWPFDSSLASTPSRPYTPSALVTLDFLRFF